MKNLTEDQILELIDDNQLSMGGVGRDRDRERDRERERDGEGGGRGNDRGIDR